MKNRHGQMDQDLYVKEMSMGLKEAEIVIITLLNTLEDLADYDDKRFEVYRQPVRIANKWLKDYE